MSRMPWLKLYTELASDPKVRMLPEAYAWRWILLLCYQREGDLPKWGITQIAFQWRVSEDEAKETLDALEKAGLVRQVNGHVEIPAWEKRQGSILTSTERVRKYRGQTKQDETQLTR